MFRWYREHGKTEGSDSRKSIKLCPAQWEKLRMRYVVVFWSEAADRFWQLSSSSKPNCLCNFLPLAIWAGCEHVQVARAILQEGYQLTCPGQNKGGRGRTNAKFAQATHANPSGQKETPEPPYPRLRWSIRRARPCVGAPRNSVLKLAWAPHPRLEAERVRRRTRRVNFCRVADIRR